MSCSNCFNNCTEIVSDRCVRYTGIDVPVLGIKNGDSLSYIEQALIEFLTATLDGTGIFPIIDNQIICKLVKDNLPTCGDLTVNDFLSALIKSVCDLQTQVTATVTDITTIKAELAALEGPYNVSSCLTGVTSTSGTHAILQAVITQLCALTIEVHTQYAQLSQINPLIATYINNETPTTQAYKMIPFTVVEYYGPLTYFDNTGAGQGDWDRIFLCNGQNGTPDKRGVVGVGVTDGTMKGGNFNPAVDPAIAGNPTYAANNSVIGSNQVVLSTKQLPSHSHAPTVTITTTLNDPGHSHKTASHEGWDSSGSIGMVTRTPFDIYSESAQTGITFGVDVQVAIGNTGGGESHNNYQPGLGCHYIMYIP